MRRTYLDYIEYRLHNDSDENMSNTKWLDKKVGELDKASEAKLRDAALTLYYRQAVSSLLHIPDTHLHVLTLNKLRALLQNIIKITENYDIQIPVLVPDTDAQAVTYMERFGKNQGVAKKPRKSKSKKCDDYTVSDLKEMAKKKQITGYSKMKKNELCKALKLK